MVGQLAELPCQVIDDAVDAHRITERNQTWAAALVHQQAFGRRCREQQLFVGQQRQVALDPANVGDELGRAVALQESGGYGARRIRPQQASQPDRQQGEHRNQACAQHARRVGIDRKLPPQLVTVIDVPIGEQTQPQGTGQHQRDVAPSGQCNAPRSSKAACR